MSITTFNDKMNMLYNQYIKQPMQAIEVKVNKIIAKNPNLLNSSNRFINHPFPIHKKNFSYNNQ